VSFAGERVVVAGSGPLLLPAAAALAASGARVRTIAEQAPSVRVGAFALRLALRPVKLAEAIRYRLRFLSARYRTGTWVAAARGDLGDSRVREVVLTDGEKTWTEACDLLCCGFGLVPNLELPRLLGCEIEDGRVRVDQAQRTSVPGVFCAGEVTGIGGADLALAEGEAAGLAAAGSSENAGRPRVDRSRHLRFARAISRAFALRGELRRLPDASTFVCRCEDVPFGALDPAWTSRQAKLYTRVGMGPCQGRVCGPALRFLFGWEPDSVRPPVSPVALSLLRSVAGTSSVSGREEVIRA
jgi:NADPH-dependent 2,4-dienoyl-CoA reductase/sulfur reductase-like enzyme